MDHATGASGASKEGANSPAKPIADVHQKYAEVDDVPDPDEDDLDDLDDMLDEFSAVQIEPKESAVAPGLGGPNAPGPPAGNKSDTEAALTNDEFAKELQAEMASLFAEVENSPEMQAQFENVFQELGVAAAEGAGAPGTTTAGLSGATRAPGGCSATEASFQETIRKTMERMQTSGEQATAAATAEGSTDFMAELLKQMEGGMDGDGNEEEFSNMLMGMMEQLTNKEILYEPMKELSERFPGWIAKNKQTVPKEDLQRYQEQQILAHEIVAKFEEPTYLDSNTADREYIVERMQKMQAAGSPPTDLVGDMPSAQDALKMPDESCNPQ